LQFPNGTRGNTKAPKGTAIADLPADPVSKPKVKKKTKK
jgi:hypothetical protein